MPLSRFLVLVVFLLCGIASGRAETFYDWVHAAPDSTITFNAWTASQNPAAFSNGESPSQGLYGYLDLSRLPPSAFPIQAYVYYAGDWDHDAYGNGFRPMPKAPTIGSAMTPVRVTLETTLDSPDKAAALPVWTSPIPMGDLYFNAGSGIFETVRVEVRGHDGALIARTFIGATGGSYGYNWNNRAVVVLNSSQALGDFTSAGFSASSVVRLVPDYRAYDDVKAVWIDGTAAGDATLTDAFWRRLMLMGTEVSGQPADVQGIATRLGVDPSTPQLLGGFTGADSGQTAAGELRSDQNGSGAFINYVNLNSQEMAGKTMHQELLDFSRWYIGLFFVVEAVVVITAFIQLRGRQRVWLWLVIPLFAIGYALVGALVAHLFVSTRAEALIEQVELQREGWPEAFLQSSCWQVRLDGAPATYTFPPDSSLAQPLGYSYGQQTETTFIFRQSTSQCDYVSAPGASRHGEARVRSWIAAQAPVAYSTDGTLKALRAFREAWVWDGSSWRELTALQEGQSVVVANAKYSDLGLMNAARNQLWGKFSEFPSFIRPLLTTKNTSALTAAGEALFIGEQDVADCQLADIADFKVQARRMVVYQFKLPKGAAGP